MQKVTELLEKNVEWIAIGLGALFMLFMTWTYVLNPVAGVTIGQDNLGPGEVDPYTLTHVGKELDNKINEGGKLATTVPSYVGAFKSTMNDTNTAVAVTDAIWPVLKPEIAVKTVTPVAQAPGPDGQAPAPAANVKVTALPVPPAPVPAEQKFGRSVVMVPDANGQMPPAPAAGQPAVGGVDKDWVTQMFKIDMSALDAEFVAKKIPPAPPGQPAFQTAFLQVEMERVELDENNQPKPETQQIIKTIPVYRNTVAPPPLPPEGAPKGDLAAYLTWATANAPDVLQPLFYTVAKGDTWVKPGTQAAVAEFNPANHLGGKGALTEEQWQQVLEYRREQIRLQNEQKKQARPARPAPGRSGPPGEGGGGGIPGVNFAPRDHFAAPPARPPYRGGGAGGPPDVRGGDGLGPVGGMEGGYGGYGGAGSGAVAPANLPIPGTDYPNAEFDPAAWKGKTVEFWAHDDTVKPDRVYAYRARYKIKNPIWAAGNIANPPTLAEQFALVSPWSGWSSPVSIPPSVNFFVVNPPMPNSTTCRFEVFKWENGEPKSEVFTVSPGDQIGGVRKKDGIDFSTGWTVVDFREDPRADTQIILVNEAGRLLTRSHRADSTDSLYKGLKEQINAAKATETASVNGGGPAPAR